MIYVIAVKGEENQDVLNRLLLTSDPFISSIRPKRPKKSKPFSTAAREMLMPSEVEVSTEDESSMDSGDETY